MQSHGPRCVALLMNSASDVITSHNAILSNITTLLSKIAELIEAFLTELAGLPAQKILNNHQIHLPPSTAALNNELKSAQTPNNPRAVYNGRPTELTGPCLSIYHPIFQKFMQEYNSPINLDEISLRDYNLANVLVSSSVQYFNNKEDRFSAIKPCLAPYLGQNFTDHATMYSYEKTWTPDGHAKVKCGLYKETEQGYDWMTKLILEIKNGVGIGQSDAVEQAQRDYVLVCTSPHGMDYRASAYQILFD